MDAETGEILREPQDTQDVQQLFGPNFVFLRTPYNYNMDAVSLETGTTNTEPSLTKQEYKEDADINVILERFGVTGQLPENVRQPQEGDFTGVTDYQSALNAVLQAQESFMEMPADLRKRLDNNPAKFVDWVNDPANKEEARKYGLVKPEEKPPAPIEVRLAKDTSEPPPTA